MFSADPLGAALDTADDTDTTADSAMALSDADALDNQPLELVIIDAGVANATALQQQLQSQNQFAQVVILDPQLDGVDQISDLLKNYEHLDALHLISHGSDGSLSLGNTDFNTAQLAGYSEQLQGWATAFSASGDLLIYGCDLVATESGQRFVDQLSALTGADVAASDDLTGAVHLGGDWQLEYRTGTIEAPQILNAELQHILQTTLADTPIVNDAPTVSRFPGDVTVAEDTVFSFSGVNAITLGDDDAGSGQLRLTLSTAQGSTLTLASSSGIAGYSGPASTLTLSGTLTDLNNAVQTLSLTPAQHFVGQETFSITLNDQGNTGTGGSLEDTTELRINFTAVNDPPERTGGTVSDLLIRNTAGLTSIGLQGLDYSPGGGTDEAAQTLTYEVTRVASAPMVGNVFLADGVTVVRPGFYTLEQLRGMQFDPLPGSTGNTTLLAWTVTDSAGESINEVIGLTQVNPNIAPVVSTTAGNQSFTEGDAPVVIDTGISITDPDGRSGLISLSSITATVTITSNYQAGDQLGFTNTARIQATQVGNTLTLSVVGGQTATAAEFQAALRSVTFFNGSDTPDETDRTISFSFFDGLDTSNDATRVVSVAGVNDAPGIIGTLPGAVTVTEDTPSAVDLSAIQVTDPDVGSGELSLTLSSTTGGVINAAAGTGIAISRTVPGNTQIILTGTLTDLNNYLADSRNITYQHGVTHTHGNQADQLRVILGDNGNSGGSGMSMSVLLGTVDVNITPVDDPMQISGDLSFNGVQGDTVSGQVLVSDPDGIASYALTGAPQSGAATYNPTTGFWTYTPFDPGWSGNDSFKLVLTDSLGNSTAQVIRIALSAIDEVTILDGLNTGSSVLPDLSAPAQIIKPSLSTEVVPEQQSAAVDGDSQADAGSEEGDSEQQDQSDDELTNVGVDTSIVTAEPVVNTPDLQIALPPLPAGTPSPTSTDSESQAVAAPPKFLDLQNLPLARQEFDKVQPFETQFVINTVEVDRSLDQFRRQIDAETEDQQQRQLLDKEVIIGITFSVSAVLLSGILRAGSLLACLISMLPLWRSFDPLPILNEHQSRQHTALSDDGNDEAIEILFDPIDRSRRNDS